jgi:hypothetical protein
MADRTIKVLTPATSYALLTLDELKLALGIDPLNTAYDERLQMLIDQYSDVIAVMCNRTFAKEKVLETWRGDYPPYENYRVFLSHWPVLEADIESVTAAGGGVIDPTAYEIETDTGKLTLLGSLGATAGDPIVVTYTGGYLLPDEAPPALKAALQLVVQAGAAQLLRGLNTGVRSISHKDARVMYFDPNATASKGGGGKGPLIGGDTISALLSAYMRYEV